MVLFTFELSYWSRLKQHGGIFTPPLKNEMLIDWVSAIEPLEARLLLNADISGSIWQEINDDGVQNPGEPGVPGVTVFFDDNRNGVVNPGEQSTITDSAGQYIFTNTPPGNYNIATEAKSGWERLPVKRLLGLGSNSQDQLWADHNETHAALWEIDPDNGFSFNFTPIASPQQDVNYSGLVADPNIPGVYYTLSDEHGSGVFNDLTSWLCRMTYYPGVGNAVVTVIGDSGYDYAAGGGVDFDPTTGVFYGGPGDNFTFNNPDGDYRLWKYNFTGNNFNTVGQILQAASGQWHSWGDMAFDDTGNLYLLHSNYNQLYRIDKTSGQILQTATLSENHSFDKSGLEYDSMIGQFYFANEALYTLNPNTGALVQIGPDWDFSTYGSPASYEIEGLEMVSLFTDRPVVVSDQSTVADIDFGHKSNVVGISGQVVLDLNTNGEIDPNEAIGVSNQTVFLDQNGNGVVDIGDATAVTNSQGYYDFTALAPGIYTVALQRQPGYDTTYPHLTIQQSHMINLQAGQYYTADFAIAETVDINGTAYDDTNVNGQRDNGELGQPGVTMYIDQDQNGVKNQLTFTTIAGPSATITDLTTSISTIQINDIYTPLSDVDVLINITHTYASDLDVYLISPRGTRVELFADIGDGGDDFNDVVLDTEAAASITAPMPVGGPFVGFYRPEGDLEDFDGEIPNGTWTLQITDDAGGDIGTLNHWAMQLTVGDFVTQTDASGNYQFTNLPPKPLIVRQELSHLRSPTEPNVLGETVIEDFEGGYAYSQVEAGDVSSLVSRAAYQGAQGLLSGRWIRGGPTVQQGDTISAHVKFKDANWGSAYFGFGATADKTLMLAMYPGMNKMALVALVDGYDNPATRYITLAEVDQGFATDFWYRIEIDWGEDGSIVGRLFGASGNMLNEIDIASQIAWPVTDGNLAFRSVGGDEVYFDQVSVRRGGERKVVVPFGSTWGGLDFGSAADGLIQGTKYQDNNGNGIFDDEVTLQNWRIYHDANQNGLFDTLASSFSNPDNYILGDYTVIAVPVQVSGLQGLIRDVNVIVDIDHTSDGDLVAYLISPSGTRVELFNHIGGSGDDFNMTFFDDSQAININAGSPPYTGNYQPSGMLADFNAENPNGTWRLVVIDDVNNAMQGIVDHVVLNLSTGDLDVLTDVNGFYIGANMPAGEYHIREQQQYGWLTTQPAGGVHNLFMNSGQWLLGIDFGNTRMGTIAGTVYHDIDENYSQNGSETGMENWTVFLDVNGDGIINQSILGFAAFGPTPILDQNTITSPLFVDSLAGRILDIDVDLNIEHTYDADLGVYLISPMGTEVELFASVGSSGDNFFDTTLDDEAAATIATGAAPFNGNWQPAGSLADFDGENPNGTWYLKITDNAAGDIGALLNWQLTITEGDPTATTNSNGDYYFDNVLPGDQSINLIAQPGWVYFNPSNGQLTPPLIIDQDITSQDFGVVLWTCPLPLPNGDFSGDCIVGLLDLDILGQFWGMTTGANKSMGDASGDGKVSLLDLDILGWTWGMNGNPAMTLSEQVVDGSAPLHEVLQVTSQTNVLAAWWMMEQQSATSFTQTLSAESVLGILSDVDDEEEQPIQLF